MQHVKLNHCSYIALLKVKHILSKVFFCAGYIREVTVHSKKYKPDEMKFMHYMMRVNWVTTRGRPGKWSSIRIKSEKRHDVAHFNHRCQFIVLPMCECFNAITNIWQAVCNLFRNSHWAHHEI